MCPRYSIWGCLSFSTVTRELPDQPDTCYIALSAKTVWLMHVRLLLVFRRTYNYASITCLYAVN